MERKVKIGISACLLGEHVRYDGGHKRDYYLTDTLGKYAEWVPVCPEVECGLPVPREAMRLTGDPADPRLTTRMSNIDHTDMMKRWIKGKLPALEREELCGFIFKSRSPSSGLRGVKVYGPSGTSVRSGSGIFARSFVDRFPFIPAEDDGRLHSPLLRENFIERVFVFNRWRAFLAKGAKRGDLVSFHTDHKLLLMSHSQKHYSFLGKMVSDANMRKKVELLNEYITSLMEGLALLATVKKHTNVLMHIAGYFKKKLSSDEKTELLGVIEGYHQGLVPLIVPITLMNHYVRKFDQQYLKRQVYLNPHPLELMLRNHV